METASRKSYRMAVSLSGVFGVLGIQHFYLGRWMEGVADVLLTIGWVYCLVVEQPLGFVIFLGIDCIHAFVVTIMLLTGSFRDGDGHLVCYPGQRLT
jgi:hypothetical protein